MQLDSPALRRSKSQCAKETTQTHHRTTFATQRDSMSWPTTVRGSKYAAETASPAKTARAMATLMNGELLLHGRGHAGLSPSGRDVYLGWAFGLPSALSSCIDLQLRLRGCASPERPMEGWTHRKQYRSNLETLPVKACEITAFQHKASRWCTTRRKGS